MRTVIFFDRYDAVLGTADVNSRNEVRQVILDNVDIELKDGTAVYWGSDDRYHGYPVSHAIYVDTEAGTSELFQISARVIPEIIIS